MKALATLLLGMLVSVAAWSQSGAPGVLNMDCDSLYTRSKGGNVLWRAKALINIDCTIRNDKNVTLQAGRKIVLGDGFHAREGSRFHAEVLPYVEFKSENPLTNDNARDYAVYPNPTNGTLQIATDFGVETPVTITITDMLGKVIYQTQQRDKLLLTYTFELEQPRGLYFVRMQAGDRVALQKVVVQ